MYRISSQIVIVVHDLVFGLLGDNRQMMNSENRSILCLNLIVPCRWRSIIFVEHDVRVIVERIMFSIDRLK